MVQQVHLVSLMDSVCFAFDTYQLHTKFSASRNQCTKIKMDTLLIVQLKQNRSLTLLGFSKKKL